MENNLYTNTVRLLCSVSAIIVIVWTASYFFSGIQFYEPDYKSYILSDGTKVECLSEEPHYGNLYQCKDGIIYMKQNNYKRLSRGEK